MKLTVDISGHTEHDLCLALEEVKKLIKSGFTGGANGNDTGSYSYSVKGSAIEFYVVGPDSAEEDAYRTKPDVFEVHDNFDEAETAYLESKVSKSLYGVLELSQGLTLIR